MSQRAPRVGGPLFESLLTLVYTAPTVGLAFYGLTRGQTPKAAQIADKLADRVRWQSMAFAAAAVTTLLFAVTTGLRFASSQPTSAVDSPVRDAALRMVASTLIGVYAIVRSLIIYRQGLEPKVLARRLHDDYVSALREDPGRGVRRAVWSASAGRADQRAEELKNLALFAAAEGRVADFGVFIESLASLRPPRGVAAEVAQALRDDVDELVVLVAENVVHRADLFDKSVDALVQRLALGEGPGGIPERVPRLFIRTLDSSAPVVAPVIRLLEKSWRIAGEAFWRQILVESISRGTDGEAWKAVRNAVANDWKISSTRISDDDLTGVVNDSLMSASMRPVTDSVVRLVDLLITINEQRPISSRVAKTLAGNFSLIAGAVPTESTLSIFGMLLVERSNAAWALSRFAQQLSPEVHLTCHLELALGRSETAPSGAATQHYLGNHELALQIQACKTILRKRRDAEGDVLWELIRLFQTQSLGHVPVIALLEESSVQGLGVSDASPSVLLQSVTRRSLRPGFSQEQESLWSVDAESAGRAKTRVDRKARADQIVAALEQLVERFEEAVESCDATTSPIPYAVVQGWDACLFLLLEIYSAHDWDERFATLIRRLIAGFRDFERLYVSLPPESPELLKKYAQQILPELLPDDAKTFIHVRFSRAVECGIVALLVGSLTRPGKNQTTEAIANDRRRYADAVVIGVGQPQTRILQTPVFLSECLGLDLAVVLDKHRSDKEYAPPREGRIDLCISLFESMTFPSMDGLSGEHVVRAWSSLLITYFDTNPVSGRKAKRARKALVRAAVLLDAFEKGFGVDADAIASEGTLDQPTSVLRARLGESLQSWLAAGRESPVLRRALGWSLHSNTDEHMPRDRFEQDRYRFHRIIAKELTAARIGVLPFVDASSPSNRADSDFLAITCRWIRPPAGVPPTEEDAEVAAAAMITSLDAALSSGELNPEQRNALLKGIREHYASHNSAGGALYDRLKPASERGLLLSVLRVLVDPARPLRDLRPAITDLEAITRAYERLQGPLKCDPMVLDPVYRGLRELQGASPQPT